MKSRAEADRAGIIDAVLLYVVRLVKTRVQSGCVILSEVKLFWNVLSIDKTTTSENAVFWDVTRCRSCMNRRFELSLQPPAHAGSSHSDFSTVKMIAMISSETSVHTRSTLRHIPQDGILHRHRREILESYKTTTSLSFVGNVPLFLKSPWRETQTSHELIDSSVVQTSLKISTNLAFTACSPWATKCRRRHYPCQCVILSIYLWFYNNFGSLGQFCGFFIFYTVGRTPWKGDQPVARPLPVQG
jgi:hypothetical protein